MNSYILRFSEQAKDDIKEHKKSGNNALVSKISLLLKEVAEHPFIGTGKPELLKHRLSGCWSRRINREHRLIYEVSDSLIFILSAKGHYK